MIFVDTNYFLRLLLKDVIKQHQEAKKIFQKAALGKIKIFTSLIVFFEIYWVLSSIYEKKKSEITKVLTNILEMNFVKLDERGLLIEALIIFSQKNLDLEDSYNLVYAGKMKAVGFKTFDQKLKKILKISRRVEKD